MKAYDCCKDALKTAINGLQEAYVKTVRTIRLNGKDYQTDGNTGVVDLGTIETKPPTASEVGTDDDRNVQVAIDAIEDEIGSETASGSILYKVKANTDAISAETTARQNEDTQLASDIADNATAIANEATARSDADDTLQTAIDEMNGSISKNTSDIASNKTEIDANASAITNLNSNALSAVYALTSDNQMVLRNLRINGDYDAQKLFATGTGLEFSGSYPEYTLANTGVISVNGNTGDIIIKAGIDLDVSNSNIISIQHGSILPENNSNGNIFEVI